MVNAHLEYANLIQILFYLALDIGGVGVEFVAELSQNRFFFIGIGDKADLAENYHAVYVQRPLVFFFIALVRNAKGRFRIALYCVELMTLGSAVKIQISVVIILIKRQRVGITVLPVKRKHAPRFGF